MNDREFLELLNLYVDREISAQDALRLEAEVAADPRRREVYDQYCRMQKACSRLSEETYTASLAQTDPSLITFPAPSAWRMAPFVAGMAAAAVVALAFVGLRNRVIPAAASAALASAGPERAHSVADTPYRADDSSAMKPVFFVKASPEQAPAQVAQLNWIGDIRMAPVASLADADFLMNPKADLKGAVMADPQAGRGTQEPVEMTAFRFQR
jgi:hypothetical protein